MREIKFRGKTVSTKEWVYGDLVHNAFNGHRIFPVGIQIPGCYPDEVIAETVGQFTGLHDKNGKEIYEGDVLSYYSGMVPKGTNPIVKQVVKWKQHQYVGINNWGMAEVIGNIHENPELLEASC